MNDRIKPTGPGPQAVIRVNLDEMPPACCPSCGGQIFATNVAMYRKLGATQSPTGKAMLARIPLDVCQDCNALCQIVGDEHKLVEIVPVGEETDDGDKSTD